MNDLELVRLAIARKESIDRGEMGTVPLEEMIAEFAPDLAIGPVLIKPNPEVTQCSEVRD